LVILACLFAFRFLKRLTYLCRRETLNFGPRRALLRSHYLPIQMPAVLHSHEHLPTWSRGPIDNGVPVLKFIRMLEHVDHYRFLLLNRLHPRAV